MEYRTVYKLPAISVPVVLYLILFGFTRLTVARMPRSLFYGPVPLRMRVF